jgi:hypothetical protein
MRHERNRRQALTLKGGVNFAGYSRHAEFAGENADAD